MFCCKRFCFSGIGDVLLFESLIMLFGTATQQLPRTAPMQTGIPPHFIRHSPYPVPSLRSSCPRAVSFFFGGLSSTFVMGNRAVGNDVWKASEHDLLRRDTSHRKQAVLVFLQSLKALSPLLLRVRLDVGQDIEQELEHLGVVLDFSLLCLGFASRVNHLHSALLAPLHKLITYLGKDEGQLWATVVVCTVSARHRADVAEFAMFQLCLLNERYEFLQRACFAYDVQGFPSFTRDPFRKLKHVRRKGFLEEAGLQPETIDGRHWRTWQHHRQDTRTSRACFEVRCFRVTKIRVQKSQS